MPIELRSSVPSTAYARPSTPPPPYLDLGAPQGRLVDYVVTTRTQVPDETRMLSAINRDQMRLDDARLRDVRQILDEHGLSSEVVECVLMQARLAPVWTDVSMVRVPDRLVHQVALATARLRYGMSMDEAINWFVKYYKAFDNNSNEASYHLTRDAIELKLSLPGLLWGEWKLIPKGTARLDG